MKTTININGKDVEITLTPDQIKVIKKTNMEITEVIKSFEDACDHQNVNIENFNKSCEGLTPDEIAYKKLKIIIKALNENKEADWNNNNEPKWYPYFDMRSASGFGFSDSDYDDWVANTNAGSRLSFRSDKLSKYAGTQFLSLYKDLLN